MISYTVVDYHKLSTLPLINTGMLMHERFQFLDEGRGDLRTVSEADSLPVVISLVDPAGVGSKHLIVEGFTAISADSDSRKDF